MTRIFADTAEVDEILKMTLSGVVDGFTTNPSLARKAGVTNYLGFCALVVLAADGLPVSLEVLADDWSEMQRQALLLAGLGSNVFVKIPVTNTRGEFSGPLIRRLSSSGVKVNVTAVFTEEQLSLVRAVLSGTSIVSVFAGRVADTGEDPEMLMNKAVWMFHHSETEVLWASAREIFNLYQARRCGCDIITLTPELIKKMALSGNDLTQFSLETVRMFRDDAVAAGFEF